MTTKQAENMTTKQADGATPSKIPLTVEELATLMQFNTELAQAQATIQALQRGQAIFIEHLRNVKGAGGDAFELNNVLDGFIPKAKAGG